MHSPGILTSDLKTYLLFIDKRQRETSVTSLKLTENGYRIIFKCLAIPLSSRYIAMQLQATVKKRQWRVAPTAKTPAKGHCVIAFPLYHFGFGAFFQIVYPKHILES